MRRTVPLVIAFTIGVLLLMQYFVPGLHDFYEVALEWSPIIAGVTAYLGIISFIQHHYRKSRKKSPDWRFSVAALLAFGVMVVAGFWGEIFEFKSPDIPPTWGEGKPEFWVSFEDRPNDAGGNVDIRWMLRNRVGEIRGFDIHRREADADDGAFVKIGELRGGDAEIGQPRVNREDHGEPLPSFVRNGGFDEGTAGGWETIGDVSEAENDYRGRFLVLADGAAVVSPAYTLPSTGRHRLSALARNVDPGASLTATVFIEGREDAPLAVLDSKDSMSAGGIDRSGEWVQVVREGLATDILAPLDEDEISYRVKFQAVGGTVQFDEVAIRPVSAEFHLEVKDEAPYNNNPGFPHYGEGASLLSSHNPTFDVTLDKWTFEPPWVEPAAAGEDAVRRRVKREDKEKKHCALVPHGTTMLSAVMPRPEDPMGHRYSYRLRSWGRGDGSPLRADIVAFTPGGEEVIGSLDWAADEDWEMKEVLVETPEETTAFQIRYLATGGDGAARVDEMFFMPVKMKPEEGVEYVYRVAALDGDGNELASVSSLPFAADFEAIGSLYHTYGVYNWLFTHVLVPMEATMFALLAFFIASAAFRAFRARSLEATLLLVAAIFVMIGRVPIGEEIWRPLGGIADWIMQYPNGGAKRAIMIGVGLGMAATSLKLMLGIERTYLGKG